MNERTFHVETERQREWLVNYAARQPVPFCAQLGPLKEKRSPPQNRRLWLLHTAASDMTGCSPARMHEDMLCEHFGYTEHRLPSGDLERVPLKRSSGRDKKEFAKFMEFVESFYGQKLGVWLDTQA